MRKLGSVEGWIKMVMKCVRLVPFSILVNSRPGDNFKPSRGLRQGDPLSPYLFILCAEGSSAMLCKVEGEGRMSGVAAVKRGTKISHLLFAYDCVIFNKANKGNWKAIQEELEKYERASGQALNKQKISILFSANTDGETQREIMQTVGVILCRDYGKYLGLPTMIDRNKFHTFKMIKERIWRNSLMSTAGREIMIKAILQLIPSYTMNVFLLPKRLCTEINALISKFW